MSSVSHLRATLVEGLHGVVLPAGVGAGLLRLRIENVDGDGDLVDDIWVSLAPSGCAIVDAGAAADATVYLSSSQADALLSSELSGLRVAGRVDLVTALGRVLVRRSPIASRFSS